MTAPFPPPDLARRSPDWVIVDTGALLNRFYSAAHEPIFFDRSKDGRLNAPDGAYGVLYVAEAAHGAFAEAFLRQPGRRLLPRDLLRSKAFVRLTTTRSLRLIKLAGPGLARLGATAEVTHGGLPYTLPQAWSAALYNAFIDADGVAYTARHDDEALCYAIFHRAESAVVESDRELDLDRAWFWKLAEAYGVGLAPAP